MKFSLKKIITIVSFSLFSFPYLFAVSTKSNPSAKLAQIIDDYPVLKGYLTIENGRGEALTGLTKAAIRANIDGYETFVNSVELYPFNSSAEGIDYNIVFPANLPTAAISFQAQAIMDFVRKMGEKDRISFYFMGSELQTLRFTLLNGERVLCENLSKKDFKFEMLSSFQNQEEPTPKTYDSLAELLQKVSAKERDRKVIIVVSDEKDGGSRISGVKLLQNIRSANIPVYSIGIRAPSVSSSVTCENFATASNGRYYYTPMIRDLKSTFLKIADLVQGSYIVRVSAPSINDNYSHTLEISVRTPEGVAKTTKNFYFSN